MDNEFNNNMSLSLNSQDNKAPKWWTGLLIFIKEIIANPSAIGAACPSTKQLARNMALQVPLNHQEFIIELGGGTGAVTAALLEHGIRSEKIIVIERSVALSAHLKSRFPHLRIIQGDASQLTSLLGNDRHHVDTVVSSLPLKSLPDEIVKAIIQETADVLKPGGLFIYYTYDVRHNVAPVFPKFTQIFSKRVWLNIPPARILVYRRDED